MTLALYRKYRPATFSEVVGQDHVTDPLRAALAAGRVNHAYLFSGPRGCGKTSSARILARSLNCAQGPTADPCGVCASCIALAPEGPGSLDVVEMDAASHGGVNDTRELRDRAFYMPAESRYRVFIIDEAHMVTKEGFNALLKIVEEPPEHLVFVFATTEPEKVLPTIRSRTHHYPFRLLPPATLRALLEKLCAAEGVTVEPTVFPLVVRAGAGSARDALSVMDQLLAGAGAEGVTYAEAVALLGVTDGALLDEMVDALAAADGAAVFGAIERVADAGHDPRRFGADLLQRLRDLIILQAIPDAVTKGLFDHPEDQLERMATQARQLPTGTLTRFAEILHTGLSDMRGTTSPRLVIELLASRMLLPSVADGEAALLHRVERLERRLAISDDDGPAAAPPPAPVRRAAAAAPVPPAAPSAPPPPGDTAASPADAPAPPTAAPSRAAAPPTPPAATPASPTADAAPLPRPEERQPDPVDHLGLPTPPVLSGPHTDTAGPAPAAAPTQGRREDSRSGSDTPVHATDPAAAPQPAPQPAAPTATPETATPETAAPETAAPVPAAAGEAPAATVADVRRLWSEILASVKGRRRTTQVLLSSATVVSLDGDQLTVSMPTAALARRIAEPGNVDVFRAALHDILGVDWRIRCVGADEAGSADRGDVAQPAPAPPAAAAPNRASDPVSPPVPGSADPDTAATHVPDGRTNRDEEDPGSAGADPDDAVNPDDPAVPMEGAGESAIDLVSSRLGGRIVPDGDGG